MRRARVRIALIVLVLGTLTGIGFLIGRTMLQQKKAEERTENTMLAPEIAQSIRQFRRVKVEEGRTVWDLRADKADFLDEGRVVVEVPELSFFADDGQSVSLSGAKGEVLLDGQKVARIDLLGGIEVTVGQYRLETPSASWIGRTNRVIAMSGVDLRGGGVQITGERMIVDLGTRRVVFLKDVRTVLTRVDEGAEETAPTDPEPVDSPAEDHDSSTPPPESEAAHAS